MTAKNIEDRARAMLNDTGQFPTWSTDDLLLWVSDGQREVNSIRPHARVSATGTLTALTDITVNTASLVIGEEFRQAMTDYVLYRAFSQKATDPDAKNRAEGHYKAFLAGV